MCGAMGCTVEVTIQHLTEPVNNDATVAQQVRHAMREIPEPIWAFLGSSRLAAPIGAHRPDLVLHGHAHRGSFAAELGPVPVRNVAVHVLGKDFELFEL